MPQEPLAVGAYGDNVTQLHNALLQLGFQLPDSEVRRKFLGPATRQAVQQVQQEHGLPVSGELDGVALEREGFLQGGENGGLVIEDELKSGGLRCLVATSSLELGIDMGAIDLVVQIEAPPGLGALGVVDGDRLEPALVQRAPAQRELQPGLICVGETPERRRAVAVALSFCASHSARQTDRRRDENDLSGRN